MKTFFYIVVLLTNTFCIAQDYKKCIIYQFSGKDSTNKHIALIQTFNQRGKIVSETFSNYKSNSKSGMIDGVYHYYYTDTFLTKRLFINHNKDTIKVLYFYNARNQCVREEYFSCERRLKKGVKRDVIFGGDLEKNRTWMKTNEVTFSYDDKDKRIKKKDGQDDIRIWQYDQLNRVTQEKGYNYDKLVFVEDYEYFNGKYKSSTTYYDDNGNPKTPKYSDNEFSPSYTSTFYLDRKGNVIKEDLITEKGIIISTEITLYDAKGRIARTIHRYIDKHFINGNEQPETTHIFKYK